MPIGEGRRLALSERLRQQVEDLAAVAERARGGTLLARADQGPALVVAPSSVCANWAPEARRFAPALRVRP